MKKLLLIFLLATITCQAFAIEAEIDGILYSTTSGTTCKVTGPANKKDGRDFTIPSIVKINGNYYSVTSIGERAFQSSFLRSIIIPNSVTSIEAKAFSGCRFLGYVTIPSSVTSIGESAFANCKNLFSITWGAGNMGFNEIFEDCSDEISVIIPDGVTSIEEMTFANSNIASVTIPSSVTSIGNGAFAGCEVTSIYYTGDIAEWCKIKFDSHPFHDSYNSSNNLYINNELVKDLVIPDGVTSIGKSAFANCNNLTSVTIPNSVTSIGDWAFVNVFRSLKQPKSTRNNHL